MSTELPCGKLIGVPSRTYHAMPDAVTSGRLRLFADRPSLFHARYIARTQPDESTPALSFGIAWHALLESDEAFQRQVVIKKYDTYATKESREWRDRMLHTGAVIIPETGKESLDTLLEMQAGMQRNPTAMKLIANTESEVTWRAKVGRFHVQARTDKWSEGGCELCSSPYFVDFKSIDDLGTDTFRNAVANNLLDWQGEFYSQVINTVRGGEGFPRYFHIVSEKNPPYNTRVYELDAETRRLAHSGVFYSLKRLKQAYDTNDFTDHDHGINSIGLPFWRLKEAERDLEAARLQLEA